MLKVITKKRSYDKVGAYKTATHPYCFQGGVWKIQSGCVEVRAMAGTVCEIGFLLRFVQRFLAEVCIGTLAKVPACYSSCERCCEYGALRVW